MGSKPLYLIRTRERQNFLGDVSLDEILQNYDLYMRMSRASWLKSFFGENKIPSNLFLTIVNADVTPDILQSWYNLGGLNGVYYYCNVIFGDPDYADKDGIKAVQEQTEAAR